MFQASKTFAASIFAMAFLGGCATTTSQAPQNSLSSMDNSRNVLSFADTLDTVLPSVVRIGTVKTNNCLLYTSPSPRDRQKSRMPSSA